MAAKCVDDEEEEQEEEDVAGENKPALLLKASLWAHVCVRVRAGMITSLRIAAHPRELIDLVVHVGGGASYIFRAFVEALLL